MLLDVARMREARDRIERKFDASAFTADNDLYNVVGDVSLAFDVHKDRDQYRLTGRVTATLELSCGRCLEAFAEAVDEEFDLLYLPHEVNRGEGEIEVEDEDLNTAFYRDGVIDLGQLMHEQFCLRIPMKPLCSEGCRGLCPECGINLNVAACNCQPRWEDPRLAALRALKPDGGDAGR
jgi:uncharacterized protein